MSETPPDDAATDGQDVDLLSGLIDQRMSRADLLKSAGAAAALAGASLSGLDAALAAPRDTRIVRAAIFPGIGSARMGNSPAEYFIGPEVPGALTSWGRKYKDASGRIKRQAARFRIYGLNAAGQVVRELTAGDADISWTVHLANKKAAWYRFVLALDLPAAKTIGPEQLSTRRNADKQGAERSMLIIDPGPRTIHGRRTSGLRYHFNSGTFMGKRVPLGELRTDEAGRLLVLGGFGHSASVTGEGPEGIANNDGWHDDTSDGPVTATVVLHGRVLPVAPAWVIVGPPKYAPDVTPIVTMYDVVHQAYVDGHTHTRRPVSFTRDIYPIFARFSGFQWVNLGFLHLYGWQSPNDFLDPQYLAKLASAHPSAAAFRRLVFRRFRHPNDPHTKDAWPRVYGDAFSQTVGKGNPYLTVTREQYQNLWDWANGRFIADWNPGATVPREFSRIPVQAQPNALNRAALQALSGGAFRPGIEAPWALRVPSLYAGLCRLRVRQPQDGPEPDYGPVLTPAIALGANGPLHRSGPGDITRWMAVPWQTDTAHCGSAYEGTTAGQPGPDLPTYWPEATPNFVLTQKAYERIMQKELPIDVRKDAFRKEGLGRKRWSRALGPDLGEPDLARNRKTLEIWPELGFISARPGPGDPSFPEVMFVETETGFREPATEEGADELPDR